MILVLDDDIQRIEHFRRWYGDSVLVWVTTPDEALNQMRVQSFSAIFFDHDLGDKRLDFGVIGMARTMERESLAVDTPIFIHSMNNVGASMLANTLGHSHNVKVVPFGQMLQIFEKQDVMADETENADDTVQ